MIDEAAAILPEAEVVRMPLEQFAREIRKRHGLFSLHFFAREEGWRVFASRGGELFQQSVEEGGGVSLCAALQNLDARLVAGPIRANEIAPLPRIQ